MNKTEKLTTKSRSLKEQPVPTFETIFHSYYNPLCFFANRLVSDLSVAQDIVTDVLVTLWKKLSSFESVYKIKAFLYISTRNACLNYNEQLYYHFQQKEIIRAQSCEFETERLNELKYVDLIGKLNAVIDSLPQKCKQVIIEAYKYGRKDREISDHLKLSKNTIRNQRNRGIQLIKSGSQFIQIKEKWLEVNYNNKL